ncbi:hypothetical protein [Streptomyces sp. NPDC029704]|uniref:hypothetical protein n=1 Tax=Streptomyces sp. NPDC029704 TaxID=3156920 RepID=UPI0034010CE2
MTSVFYERLAAAHARIERGNNEQAAGADDKARAIAEEVDRRGRGGARQLAAELGVSEKTISQAVARARRAPEAARALPADTLERLLAAERAALPPLTAAQWQALAFIVRGTVVDVTWIEEPGVLLAGEVEDAGLDERIDPAGLVRACRGWSRAQALAVIDACLKDEVADLPMAASGR